MGHNRAMNDTLGFVDPAAAIQWKNPQKTVAKTLVATILALARSPH